MRFFANASQQTGSKPLVSLTLEEPNLDKAFGAGLGAVAFFRWPFVCAAPYRVFCGTIPGSALGFSNFCFVIPTGMVDFFFRAVVCLP
jgi:hypothetical protein